MAVGTELYKMFLYYSMIHINIIGSLENPAKLFIYNLTSNFAAAVLLNLLISEIPVVCTMFVKSKKKILSISSYCPLY